MPISLKNGDISVRMMKSMRLLYYLTYASEASRKKKSNMLKNVAKLWQK